MGWKAEHGSTFQVGNGAETREKLHRVEPVISNPINVSSTDRQDEQEGYKYLTITHTHAQSLWLCPRVYLHSVYVWARGTEEHCKHSQRQRLWQYQPKDIVEPQLKLTTHIWIIWFCRLMNKKKKKIHSVIRWLREKQSATLIGN